MDRFHEVVSMSNVSLFIAIFSVLGFLGFCGLLCCIATIKSRKRSRVFNDPNKKLRNIQRTSTEGIPTDPCTQDFEGDVLPSSTPRQSENKLTRSSSARSEHDDLQSF